MIEARFLFDLRPEQVGVVIHPESVIHSMVEWVDGAVTASLGETTMRGPIAHVLHHPRRLPNVLKPIDWGRLGQLRFEDPDEERFPSLSMARRCLEKEGNAPVILNAANEVAVEAFLAKRISFTKIFSTIDQTLQSLPWAALRDVEEVVDWDEKARRVAKQVLDRVK
jgi:1-deoxy-D-xylulose-5-phosphate reductoisomerase